MHARRETIAFRRVAGEASFEPRQTTLEPILTINLVLANGRTVSGSLVPCWDPDRSTQAKFVGTLVDDTVKGTL